jgi:enoyl-CoA hydratase
MADAKEMIYSGRFYTAQQCLEMRLVQKVLPAAEVIPFAKKVAARYAKGAAVALSMAKRAVQRGMDCAEEEGLIIEAQGIAICFASEDQKIGMRTFLEKGPGKAEFVGR